MRFSNHVAHWCRTVCAHDRHTAPHSPGGLTFCGRRCCPDRNVGWCVGSGTGANTVSHAREVWGRVHSGDPCGTKPNPAHTLAADTAQGPWATAGKLCRNACAVRRPTTWRPVFAGWGGGLGARFRPLPQHKKRTARSSTVLARACGDARTHAHLNSHIA